MEPDSSFLGCKQGIHVIFFLAMQLFFWQISKMKSDIQNNIFFDLNMRLEPLETSDLRNTNCSLSLRRQELPRAARRPGRRCGGAAAGGLCVACVAYYKPLGT